MNRKFECLKLKYKEIRKKCEKILTVPLVQMKFPVNFHLQSTNKKNVLQMFKVSKKL